jgi:hypothetical protein
MNKIPVLNALLAAARQHPRQLLSPAVHWPMNNDAMFEPSLEHLLAQDLGQPILEQYSAIHIHEAIEKEKNRLVHSIIRLLQQQAPPKTTNADQTLVPSRQVSVVPGTTRVVDEIGSQIRISEPYIDATTLPGIEQAESVAPRSNRGGHTETFPEVSKKLSLKLLFQ